MTIHHLNCGSLNPHFPKLKSLVYCLLVESNKGLILVDTGMGTGDYSHPSFMMKVFMRLLGVPRDVKETAIERVKELGFSPSEVKHIVLTHLHLDHAGGLPDFPNAYIHVYRREYEAMVYHHGLLSWGCDKAHFRHSPHWIHHDYQDETWYGFQCISIMEGLEPDMKLILLPGHTRGHCGVAIKTKMSWLLHCGDAVSPFNKHTDVNDLAEEQHRMPHIPLWLIHKMIGSHMSALRKLRLYSTDQIDLISGHDIYSFQKFTHLI